MADLKISELPAKATLDTGDTFVLVDSADATTKKTTVAFNQNLKTTDNVIFQDITAQDTMSIRGAGKLVMNRTAGVVDSFIQFFEADFEIGRISGDRTHQKIYFSSEDQTITTPWIAFYDLTGNVGINTAAATVPEKLSITAGNIQLDNTNSLKMFNSGSTASAIITVDGSNVLRLDAPTGGSINIAGTVASNISLATGADTVTVPGAFQADGTITFSSLNVLNGILTTDANGDLASSVTLPNGTLATTQAPSDNSTKLATTAYVDASTATANEFSELTDVTGAYTTGNAMWATTASADAMRETTLLVTEPAANQFTLTRGTSAFVVQADLTVEATSLVNQDLTSDATPTFDDIKQTVHTNDVSNPPTDAELDAIFGTPGTVGAGFTAYIDDNGAGTNFYQIVSDGTNWWIFTGTVAA